MTQAECIHETARAFADLQTLIHQVERHGWRWIGRRYDKDKGEHVFLRYMSDRDWAPRNYLTKNYPFVIKIITRPYPQIVLDR